MPNWHEMIARLQTFCKSIKVLEKILDWFSKRWKPRGTNISVKTPSISIAVELRTENPSVSINFQEGKTLEIKTGSDTIWQTKMNESMVETMKGAVPNET